MPFLSEFQRKGITERVSFLWQVGSSTLDNSPTVFRTASGLPFTQEVALSTGLSKRAKNMGAKENTRVVSPAFVSRARGQQGRQLYCQQSGPSSPTTQTKATVVAAVVVVIKRRRSLAQKMERGRKAQRQLRRGPSDSLLERVSREITWRSRPY